MRPPLSVSKAKTTFNLDPPDLPCMDLHIRRAAKADVPALSEILNRSWLASCPEFLPGPCVQSWVENGRARRQIEIIWPRCLLADAGQGSPLGFVSVRGSQVEMLWVLPEAWGQGIGSRLLATAEADIRSRGRFRGELLAYRENTRALAFYRAKGWRPVKEFVEIAPGGLLLPVLRLEKDLYACGASPSTSLSADSKQSTTASPTARVR